MIVGASLASYAGFQQNLNLLQATAHATSTQIAAASKEAVILGADLTLPATSAADAARAMTELARGGLNVTDAMNAAKGALQLSAAAGIDVGTASLITAKNLNAFHLAGTDATKVVDILTNAYTHAGVPITDFANGLSNVSAVAHVNGISLSDVATAMAVLTKSGVDASTAGTELRAVILRLAAPTSPAAKAIKELGLNIFDAQGQMIPFRDIIDKLSVSISKLSPEKQDQAFKTIFGNRAIGEALILAKGGTESFDQMSAAINKTGSAADIAGARMKGLSGTLEGIKSQVETVGISFGQVLAPAAQGILNVLTVQSARLTDFSTAVATALTPAVVTRYTDAFTSGAHEVIGALDGIQGPAAGAALAIGSIFASQIPIINAFVPEISLVSGVLFGVIGQSAQARDALLGFGTTLLSIGRDQAPAVIGALRQINAAAGPAFAALFDGASRAAVVIGPVLGGAARDLGPPIAALVTAIGNLGGAVLPELANAARDLAPILVGALKLGLTAVADVLGFVADHVKGLVPLLVGLGAGFLALKTAEAAAAAVTSLVKVLALAPANLAAINPILLGIGVTITALTTIFLLNTNKANENKKAINDFRDAIISAGDAVQGTQNRITDIVKGSTDLQQVLVSAKTTASDLGAALAGSGPQFQAFEDRLITAKIASSGLSTEMQTNLNAALAASGGDVDKFLVQLRAFSTLGENTAAVDALIQKLTTLRDQQGKGVTAASLEAAANFDDAKAHDAATKAVDDQRRAIDDLASATLAAIDASVRDARNQTEANRAVEDAAVAQQNLLKVLANGKSTAADATAAQRAYEDANNRVTDSVRAIGAGAVDTAQKQAVLEGKSKDSVDTFTVYKQALLDAAAANNSLAPAADKVIATLTTTAAKAPGTAAAIGKAITDGIAAGIGAGTGADITAMYDLSAQLADPNIVARARADAAAIGKGAAAGVAAGIGLGTPAAVAAMQTLANDVIAAGKTTAIIKSPSKKTHDEIGVPLAQGIAEGIMAAIPESKAAGMAVVNAVRDGMKDAKNDALSELLTIGNAINDQVKAIRGQSQALSDAARIAAGVAVAIPFPELVSLEVAKRVKDAQNKSTTDSIEQTIQQQVNDRLASQGIAGTGAGAQDPKALFWISINGQQQLFQGTEAQAIAKAKQLGGLETPIIQGFNDPSSEVARNQAATDAAAKAISDAATAAANQNQLLFNHQLISATQYLADLREQLGKLTPLTADYFTVLDQITAVNKGITDAQTAAATAQQASLDAVLHREQLMYDHQMLASDAFLADLQGRMAQVTQYSDQWFTILDEIKKVQADQASKITGKSFLVTIDNNGQNLSEEKLAELLARTARITPDHFASI